jgi:hypothetical protein
MELDIWTRLCHKMNYDYYCDDDSDCNIRQVFVLCMSGCSKNDILVTYVS